MLDIRRPVQRCRQTISEVLSDGIILRSEASPRQGRKETRRRSIGRDHLCGQRRSERLEAKYQKARRDLTAGLFIFGEGLGRFMRLRRRSRGERQRVEAWAVGGNETYAPASVTFFRKLTKFRALIQPLAAAGKSGTLTVDRWKTTPVKTRRLQAQSRRSASGRTRTQSPGHSSNRPATCQSVAAGMPALAIIWAVPAGSLSLRSR